MTNGLSLNLQLLQNITDTSTKSVSNNKPAVYAKEGEPRYNEEMDLDKDGVVTMEEYRQYCEENNIGTDAQIQNVQSMGDSVIQKRTENSADNMSYDEYMQYCEENQNIRSNFSSPAVDAEIDETGIVVRNFGKALNSYSVNNINLPSMKIERSV